MFHVQKIESLDRPDLQPYRTLRRSQEHCDRGIFVAEGEAGFRRRESAALADIAARTGIALATGGGAVLAEENRRCLRERGFVVRRLEISPLRRAWLS